MNHLKSNPNGYVTKGVYMWVGVLQCVHVRRVCMCVCICVRRVCMCVRVHVSCNAFQIFYKFTCMCTKFTEKLHLHIYI